MFKMVAEQAKQHNQYMQRKTSSESYLCSLHKG